MSRAVTVTVDVATPFATTDAGADETVDWPAFTAPAVNVTGAVCAMLDPSSVAETVAVAATVEEVSVAVYVPFALSVTALSVPAAVASATVPPLTARLVAALFFSRTVIVEVVTPFATIAVTTSTITVRLKNNAATNL